MSVFLELVEISKHYPGVAALDRVTLSVAAGEVIGLIGENGAGKSTLMNVLGGVVEPSAGAIRVDGVERKPFTVGDAIKAGIAFVHQELNLFDNLDAAANVFIGREPLSGGFLRLIDRKKLYAAVQPLLDRLGVDFRPDTPVAEMSLAQRQLLEIVKAMSLDARLVIMDEPTSSLTITETERLMRVIAGLKQQNVSIIFISHRLNEVQACADRVVVLRDGRLVGELERAHIAHGAMIRLMIGRDLKALYIPPAAERAEGTTLEITGIRTATYPDNAISLAVRGGEILGLAGLVGSGRTELARAVFGIDPVLAGGLRMNGEPIQIRTPREAIDRGIFLVPEDRKRAGLLLDLSIAGNISLPDLRSYARGLIVRKQAEIDNADRQKERLNIRTPSVLTEVGTLSGGNQQKVVLAKWLSMQPKVIIFDEPTRGIDVGAKQEIYAMLRVLANSGVAILMISSDMEEVIGVSDRIAVMHEGRISGFLDRAEFSEHNVLQLAVGTQPS
jgi:ribose transport system ATP-binding protein